MNEDNINKLEDTDVARDLPNITKCALQKSRSQALTKDDDLLTISKKSCTSNTGIANIQQIEHKKRAHSDSMLYGLTKVSPLTLDLSNEKYLNCTEPSGISCAVSLSSEKTLAYDFCSWVSVPSSCKSEKLSKMSSNCNHDLVKLKSTTQDVGLKLVGRSPGSPKKSPKDYWLLKHSSLYNSLPLSEDSETSQEHIPLNFTSDIRKRRTLSTIIDNSPENEEASFLMSIPHYISPHVKSVGDVPLMKHKKYLQRKYQQQSSSSLESDDVFIETPKCGASTSEGVQIKDVSREHKSSAGLVTVVPMDVTEEIACSTMSQNQPTFTIFTFPPTNKMYRDPCLSESESGLLSPAALSSIASSPGVISPVAGSDVPCQCPNEALPIVAGLERFALSSDTSIPSYHHLEEVAVSDRKSSEHCLNLSTDKFGCLTDMKTCLELQSGTSHHPSKEDILDCPSSISDDTKHFMPVDVDTHNFQDDRVKHESLKQSGGFSQEPSIQFFPFSRLPTHMLQIFNVNTHQSAKLGSSPDTLSSSAPDLLKDISTSDSNRSHICQICDRIFSRSDMLSRHMRLHTGQRPYECRTCGQVFSRSDHLQTHLRTHTGEKPYRCAQCSYAAPRRDMVTRHMRVHVRGKTRKGKKGTSEHDPLPPLHLENFIIVDEKYFARSKLAETCQKEISKVNPCFDIRENNGQDMKRGSNSEINEESSRISSLPAFKPTIKLVSPCDYAAVSQSPRDIQQFSRTPTETFKESEIQFSYQPLDLSYQQQQRVTDNQPLHHHYHATQEQLSVDWKRLGQSQIEKKKNRNWSLAEVSIQGSKQSHIDEQQTRRHSSLSSACHASLANRRDSTMSIDSGVSYTTPTSLVYSACSPGIASGDSPEVFTPVLREATYFLWPSVASGSPVTLASTGRSNEQDSVFCP